MTAQGARLCREIQVSLGESPGYLELNRIPQVDKDSGEVGGVWGVWKHRQRYTERVYVFIDWRLSCMVMGGACQVGYMRMNKSLGTCLVNRVKDFEFQPINIMESMNNLSRWNIIGL